jgi:very-short-patch-repair endonuclease
MNLLDTHPELCEEWDYDKNSRTPEKFTYGSNVKIWWLCKKSSKCGCLHSYESSICARTNPKKLCGCPYPGCCRSPRKCCEHESLLGKFPELCEEWDYNKNLKVIKPEDVLPHSGIEVWWICPKTTCEFKCQHSWKTPIENRTSDKKKYGCPYPGCCHSPNHHCIHQSLAYLHPDIYKEWDYEANKNITVFGKIKSKPEDYTPGSSININWFCKNLCEGCGSYHKWIASPKTKLSSNLNGCPFCSSNNKTPHCLQLSFAYRYGDLAEEWCGEKNGDDCNPGIFLPHSDEIVWWECFKLFECGCPHEWKAAIKDRTRGSGCPYCSHKRICKHNSLAYLKPDIMTEWDYENNELNPEKVSAHSAKKVHWICSKNNSHKWITTIEHRTREKNPTNCPRCKHKTEYKLLDWLNENYPNEIRCQVRFEWCKSPRDITLPFDFVIEKFNLIIELDGPQHFMQISNWTSPEKIQERDKYKMQAANNNGYTVIRLLQEDVLNDLNDWDVKLKDYIHLYDEPLKLYIDNNNIYDIYFTI